MAARKRLTHSQKTRDKIQTSMIVQRLEKFIQSDQEDDVDLDGKKTIKLTPAQVTASLGLLKKTLPDLTQVDGSMDVTHTLSDKAKKWLGQ